MRPERLVIPFALLAAVSQFNLGRVLGPATPDIISVQLSFDSQDFWAAMAQWGPDGVRRFRAMLLPWDMLHPLIYGTFGRLLVLHTRLFWAASAPWRARLSWLLPLAAACDLAENLCELQVLSLTPGTPSRLIPLGAAFALAKWGLSAGFLLLALAAGARRLFPLR